MEQRHRGPGRSPGRPERLRRVAIALVAALAAGTARGEASSLRAFEAALRESADAGAVAVWVEANRLEEEGRFLRAAEHFERLRAEFPDRPMPTWRAARSYWLVGDELPTEDKNGRVAYFELAERLSSRGLELDPDCAECMLWKFAAMGRLRTTAGVWRGIRQLPEMAELLDRGIALNPTYAEKDNSTLGNLHYSSAIFYRLMPEWFWLRWLVGVGGDKERALRHVQAALALHPARVDYQVELAAQLLCLGSSRDQPQRLAAGLEVARRAVALESEASYEQGERAAAIIMLEHPEKACGYSGDGWLELDESEAASLFE